jgi:hypothetical protein
VPLPRVDGQLLWTRAENEVYTKSVRELNQPLFRLTSAAVWTELMSAAPFDEEACLAAANLVSP